MRGGAEPLIGTEANGMAVRTLWPELYGTRRIGMRGGVEPLIGKVAYGMLELML
jgi:hypothetical protein